MKGRFETIEKGMKRFFMDQSVLLFSYYDSATDPPRLLDSYDQPAEGASRSRSLAVSNTPNSLSW